MIPYRKMLFAVDFDRTFTGDIALWRWFISGASKRGHRFICVTGRTDTPHSRKEIQHIFGPRVSAIFKELIFCNHSPKRVITRARGYAVDVWIDDMPEGVGAADPAAFRALEQLYPVCEVLPVFEKDAVDPHHIWVPPSFEWATKNDK